MPEQLCREASRTVTALIMQLAAEASVNETISLGRLRRILASIESTNDLHRRASHRCRSARLTGSIAFRRQHILGRIIAQPLEPLLFATPPVLQRGMLMPLFETVRAMIGDETYAKLDQDAKDLYFGMLTEADHFEWDPFYSHQQTIALYCDLAMLLTKLFCEYNYARDSFIYRMNAQLGGTESDKVFTAEHFFTILNAFLRPLQVPADQSPRRAWLEATRPRSEYGAIDAFIEVLQADRRRWRKLQEAAVRVRMSA
jgi:hypothetical protein